MYNEVMKKYRCVDLFAGAGGFSAGLGKAGFECVFALDIDPDASKSFQFNHPNIPFYEGNISDISGRTILERTGLKPGELDLMVGGPPCQGFSTVGNKNYADPRNQLFLHYFRILRDLKPAYVIFENVSGFKRMYGGEMFHAVCEEFSRCGYEVAPQIVNAIEYGVPQFRERTIIVAWKEDFRFEQPQPTHAKMQSDLFCEAGTLEPPLTLEDALSDLPLIKSGEEAKQYACKPKNAYQAERRNGSKVLAEHVGPNHGDSLLQRIKKVPPGGSILDLPVELRPQSYFANTYARLWWDKPSTTITRNFGTPSSSRCIHPLCDRGLTTREGARLQSFDDTYVFYGSTSSKNLQIGNAVPPLLARAFGQAIIRSMESPSKQARPALKAIA